ncbi:unnamed protein product [Cuscuta epithymum]|uniref:Uncharacterized protein n=1 Tax=Cuscuta epithymum TaxID=186058 RepID=A0AAV0GHW0_9ASTE|nr:unnamed protein product [Cuscuta epithymum]
MATLSTPPTPSRSGSAAGGAPPKRQGVSVLESINTFVIRVKKKLAMRSGLSKLRLRKPKNFPARMSTKSVNRRKKARDDADKEAQDPGEGGLWRREILMGDRCQPLDFPGVIYYDCNGKRLPDLPMRSPRASPLPGFLLKSAKV